jgi:hypothetical protein
MPEASSTLVTAADTLSELLYTAGSLLALFVAVVATAGGLAAGFSGDTVPGGIFLLVGITFLLLGATTTRRGRRRLARRQEPTAFGRQPTVESRTVRPEESFDDRCVRCGASVESGAVRRYREETLVAGVPVYTHETGENAYCLDCALDEFGVGDDPADTDDSALDALADRELEVSESPR